ncbi:MAG: DNA polymerase IV [Sphaerochaetaceae bacterium]|nr:DNA polymerase IV [Sphaerochaetaceae bacterium]
MENVWFHVDMDAFYASVEQLDHKELRGKPVIVGGHSNRGVVAACSYEARDFGVHSAMPIFMAKRLCPQALYVTPRMNRYSEVSRNIISILKTFSPHVQQISIDEAFLDMSGTRRLFGIPRECGAALKKKVYDETGLIISVGIGSSKLIAKLASDYDKPNGLCRVSKNREIDFIDSIALKKIPGIGRIMLVQLEKYGIDSPGKLRTYTLDHLQRLFGETSGDFLYNVCRGSDPGMYAEESKSRSISNETTFESDTFDIAVIRSYLLSLSHQVAYRMIEQKVHSFTVAVKLRLDDFSLVSGQLTTESPFLSAEEIYHAAKSLVDTKWDRKRAVRLVGVGLNNVQDGEYSPQQTLFEDPLYSKKRAVEKVVSSLITEGKPLQKATSMSVRKKQG